MSLKKPNGFIIFASEWKQKNAPRMSLAQATAEAGKLWADMDDDARAPYNNKAKQTRSITRKLEKLTCTGMPISQLDKELMDKVNKERLTKRAIETTVSQSVKAGRLQYQSYYFVMVNYFTKTMKKGTCVPAEIAVCEFSLASGVSRLYQTLVNPGAIVNGYQYETRQHSESTHNLPVPPNALGEDNLGNIYKKILNFVCGDTKDYPPVYTLQECINVVESGLEFLKADDSNTINLKVYPIQYLMCILKEATCQAGDLEKPKNFYVTEAYFEHDFYEYQCGISCSFHQQNEKYKYCTQSYVTRWGYMFAKYMCTDLGISFIPGRHCPDSNLNVLKTPALSTCEESGSLISIDPSLSCVSTPIASSDSFFDQTRRYETKINTSLSAAKNEKDKVDLKPLSNPSYSQDDKACSKASDPSTSRSCYTTRQLDSSDFDNNLSKSHDLNSELNDLNFVASFGRGRPRRLSSCNTSGNLSSNNSDCTSVVSFVRGRGSVINAALDTDADFNLKSTDNNCVSSFGRGRGRALAALMM